MSTSLHDRLALALTLAGVDQAEAMQALLDAILDETEALEARVLMLHGGCLETWRAAPGEPASYTIALDVHDEGFPTWRQAVQDDGDVVLAVALPLAPGIDAGLLGLRVRSRRRAVRRARTHLDTLSLHAASIASSARADLERRLMEQAAHPARVGSPEVRARAITLHRRALWASSALHRANDGGDTDWAEDAAKHLGVVRELTAELIAALGETATRA